jgi:hypothetical protein
MQSNTQDTTWVSPTVDKIEKAKEKGESEQRTSTKPSTEPYSPSTNWLSQMANKFSTGFSSKYHVSQIVFIINDINSLTNYHIPSTKSSL